MTHTFAQNILMITMILCSYPGLSKGQSAHVDFGSFLGTGSTNATGDVQFVGGYLLGAEYAFPIAATLSVAPRLEVINSFVDIYDGESPVNLEYNYEHRLMGLGISLDYQPDLPWITGGRLAVAAGSGFTSLIVDEDRQDEFIQYDLGGAAARYLSLDAGPYWMLGAGVGLRLSYHLHMMEVDQSDLHGTYKGQRQIGSGSVLALQGRYSDTMFSPPQTLSSKTHAMKLTVGVML